MSLNQEQGRFEHDAETKLDKAVESSVDLCQLMALAIAGWQRGRRLALLSAVSQEHPGNKCVCHNNRSELSSIEHVLNAADMLGHSLKIVNVMKRGQICFVLGASGTGQST